MKLILAFMLCLPFSSVLASEGDFKHFKISLGGYAISSADTTISVNERYLGVGVSIDPQETLGTDLEKNVFRLDGYYRFNPRHAVHLSWYKVSNSAEKVLATDFEWVDQDGNEYLIEAGAQLDSAIGFDITRLSYRWAFYDSDKVELHTTAGLHYTTFHVDIDVTQTVSGQSYRGLQ